MKRYVTLRRDGDRNDIIGFKTSGEPFVVTNENVTREMELIIRKKIFDNYHMALKTTLDIREDNVEEHYDALMKKMFVDFVDACYERSLLITRLDFDLFDLDDLRLFLEESEDTREISTFFPKSVRSVNRGFTILRYPSVINFIASYKKDLNPDGDLIVFNGKLYYIEVNRNIIF